MAQVRFKNKISKGIRLSIRIKLAKVAYFSFPE